MRQTSLLVLFFLFLTTLCAGQGQKVFVIDTVVGGAVYDNLPATATPLSWPTGLWLDRAGALWIADTGNQVIRKLDPATGLLKVVAGGGAVVEDSTPVPGLQARLERPLFLAGDSAGNIYFSDSGSNRVRKITPDGQVTTVVGTGQAGFSGDGGPARSAKLYYPTGLTFDAGGNLYITDAGNCRIRKLDTSGAITTFAGNGTCAHSGDGGPALSAGLAGGTAPWPQGMQGLAFDSRGNLYLTSGNIIRRIDRATGIITTAVGTVTNADCSPIPNGISPTSRAFCHPISILFDQNDNMFFTSNGGLYKLSVATGLITYVTGGTGVVVVDSSGRFMLSHANFGQVYRVDANGAGIVALAGTGATFDGPGRLAVVSSPQGLALDGTNNLYFADNGQRRVRRFDPVSGQVTTVAGGGSTRLADGVAATAADLGDIRNVFVDSKGNIFFNHPFTLWKADARSGIITRVAGRDDVGFLYTGDGGPALQATFGHIAGIAVDAAGNIFLSDAFGGVPGQGVRRIDASTGIINTVALTSAIGAPRGLAFDRQGQLLIGHGCYLSRLNPSTGVINPVQVRSQASDPLTTFQDCPRGGGPIGVDGDGNIFLTTFLPSRVQEIRASDSVLLTVAGGSAEGFFGDGGLATSARLAVAGGTTADSLGNVYFTDDFNGRIRKLTPTVVLPVMALSPGTLFFSQVQGSSVFSAQLLNVSSANNLPYNWTLEISTGAGGNWLNASPTSGSAPAPVILTVDASKLGVGTYRGTVTVKSTGASNSPQTVDVVLTVTGVAGAVLGISQQFLSFAAVAGGANPPPQSISVSNTGSGTLSWSATAETSNGGPWLKISAALGAAPSALSISADITGLAQGIYQGRVIVRNLVGSDSFNISVVLVVTKTQPILLPTQTGFLFVGVEGSLVIGPQSFAIQNAGQGSMDWQIQVNLPGGGDWLRVSPLSGTSVAGQPAPSVTLLMDPSKLRAGVSVGLLSITGSGASNSPQTGIVLVNMLARGSLPVGTINPLGLIFTAASGSATALTQGLTIASTGGQALQFLASGRTQAGGNWLSVTPEQGVLLSSAESASLSLQANPSGLSTGVYFGTVRLSFGTGVTQEVAVALVVTPAGGASPAPTNRADVGADLRVRPAALMSEGAHTGAPLQPPAAGCTPRRLVVVETKLGNLFSVQVGWPVPMLMKVVDDCGTAATAATVTASFTTGEAPLAFQNLRDGTYSATWVPVTQGQVGVTARAVSTGLEDGVAQFTGKLGVGSTLPLVFRDGWVNAASFDRFKPLAPGMIFSVFGSNLADGKNFATAVPLPRSLGNLKVSLGGVDAPLFYADGGQVNAQVPFELATVGTASLVASGRGSAGAPGTVTIVGAQPGVFTISQSGTGQGVVLDAQFRVADSTNPVKAGDVVQIYATGLGLTNPAVASGAGTPASPLANVATPVKITIGGLDAQVDFAGLAPGFVGLYQVNARVPAGVTAGSSVSLLITQNGVASNTVTIAVRQ